MNLTDSDLDRLFRAAAVARRSEGVEAMPPVLQARVLAARREWLARRAAGELEAVLVVMRRCLVGAALVAGLAMAVCHHVEAQRVESRIPNPDLMVLESVAELSLFP